MIDFSTEIGDDRGIAYGNFYMARIFIDYDYDIAENFLLISLEFAKKNDDRLLLGKLYNTIGTLKSKVGLYDDEISYYQKALEVLETIGNDSLIAALYNNFGIAYDEKGDNNFAIEYYLQAAEINIERQNWLWLSTNYLNIGSSYIESSEFDKAFDYLHQSQELASKYNYSRLLPWLYNNLSELYTKTGDLEKSQHYAMLAVENSRLMNNRVQEIAGLTHLKDIYENQNDIENAYHVLVQLKSVSDSLMQNDRLSEIDRLNMVYKYEREIELTELKHKNQTLLYWTTIIVLIFTVSIAFTLVYLQRLRSKKDQAVKEKLEIEKEILKKEIDSKSRELITKIMHLSNMNEMITDILDKLTSHKLNFKEENQKNINEIIASLKRNKKTNILESFDMEFTQVHPSFFEKLSIDFPELTQNEKRLCAFLKLNMNSKEICEISHLELSSVEKARTRLRKKLKLTGSDVQLTSFLQAY